MLPDHYLNSCFWFLGQKRKRQGGGAGEGRGGGGEWDGSRDEFEPPVFFTKICFPER